MCFILHLAAREVPPLTNERVVGGVQDAAMRDTAPHPGCRTFKSTVHNIFHRSDHILKNMVDISSYAKTVQPEIRIHKAHQKTHKNRFANTGLHNCFFVRYRFWYQSNIHGYAYSLVSALRLMRGDGNDVLSRTALRLRVSEVSKRG